jgi:hypothetical protein
MLLRRVNGDRHHHLLSLFGRPCSKPTLTKSLRFRLNWAMLSVSRAKYARGSSFPLNVAVVTLEPCESRTRQQHFAATPMVHSRSAAASCSGHAPSWRAEFVADALLYHSNSAKSWPSVCALETAQFSAILRISRALIFRERRPIRQISCLWHLSLYPQIGDLHTASSNQQPISRAFVRDGEWPSPGRPRKEEHLVAKFFFRTQSSWLSPQNT